MTTTNPTGNQALPDGTDARIERVLALATEKEGQTSRVALKDLREAMSLLNEVVAEQAFEIAELGR